MVSVWLDQRSATIVHPGPRHLQVLRVLLLPLGTGGNRHPTQTWRESASGFANPLAQPLSVPKFRLYFDRRRRYSIDMAATAAKNQIRQGVLRYVSNHESPVRMSNMADDLRKEIPALAQLRDSDVRGVVQSMIVTGKLSYAPGLKIQLGPTR